MIKEQVICDMCGIEIPKEEKDMWHNINVVRHVKVSRGTDKSGIKDYPASFHVCTDDLKNILFEVMGVNLDEDHQKVMKKKIEEKLRIFS